MSDFGRGFTYCIGLFLMHAERMAKDPMYEQFKEMEHINAYERLWFNGAADHLYDLETPENLPQNIKDEINAWREKCLRWRLALMHEEHPGEEDFQWAVRKAKDFLMAADEFMGVTPMKAEYE